MTPAEAIDQSRETIARLESVIAGLEKLPDSVQVDSVSATGILFRNATYAENMATLHVIRQAFGEVELYQYYASYDGTLALQYETQSVSVILYCTDTENALARASGGKCRLVTERREIVDQTVVCGIGGES